MFGYTALMETITEAKTNFARTLIRSPCFKNKDPTTLLLKCIVGAFSLHTQCQAHEVFCLFLIKNAKRRRWITYCDSLTCNPGS